MSGEPIEKITCQTRLKNIALQCKEGAVWMGKKVKEFVFAHPDVILLIASLAATLIFYPMGYVAAYAAGSSIKDFAWIKKGIGYLPSKFSIVCVAALAGGVWMQWIVLSVFSLALLGAINGLTYRCKETKVQEKRTLL